MGLYTIPDKGEPLNDIQAVHFQEDFEIFRDGVLGTNCVLSGGDVTPSSGLTVAIAKGSALSNSKMFAFAATTNTHTTADATNPRIDFIVMDSSGVIQLRTGTAAANPKPPNRTTNDVVLASVLITATLTTVASGNIYSRQMTRTVGPICIYQATTAVTTNTAATVELLNKANSGLTVPDGLLLAGRSLDVTIGGKIKVGTANAPQLAVRYGGTTMYNYTFPVPVADTANYSAFVLNFRLIAQANAVQALIGTMQISPDFTAARALPTTGFGVIYQNTTANEGLSAIGGAAAVDSNAANRLLSVLWTQTSNANNEVVVSFSNVDLR